MEMTDKEIYKRFEQSGRKKQQIRILAELNDCDCKDIQAIIDRMDRTGKKEPAKRGRPKKVEKPAAGTPQSVIMAVRNRVIEIEQKTADLKEAIEQKQKTFEWFMAEWAELKEWQQEYDTDISGQAI